MSREQERKLCDPQHTGAPRYIDWQAADEEFYKQAKLDGIRRGEASKQLAQRNCVGGFDGIVLLDEGTHTYWHQGVRIPRSVTSVIGRYCESFHAMEVADRMVRGSNWPRCGYMKEDGTSMDVAEIVAYWEKSGAIASARGTLFHAHVEDHLNGVSISKPYSPEFQQYLAYHCEVVEKRGWKAYRTELTLYSRELDVAGQVDALYTDPGGQIVMVDWKRSKEIKYYSQWSCMKPPLEDWDDCNWNKYVLQQNLYKYIMAHGYNLAIAEMYLLVCHPNQDGYSLLEVPRVDSTVEAIVADYLGATQQWLRKGEARALGKWCVCWNVINGYVSGNAVDHRKKYDACVLELTRLWRKRTSSTLVGWARSEQDM